MADKEINDWNKLKEKLSFSCNIGQFQKSEMSGDEKVLGLSTDMLIDLPGCRNRNLPKTKEVKVRIQFTDRTGLAYRSSLLNLGMT